MLIGPKGMGKASLMACASAIAGNNHFEAPHMRSALPCRCGYYGDAIRECMCSLQDIRHYRRKLCADSYYIVIECPRVEFNKLMHDTEGEKSETIAKRVVLARKFLPKVKDDIPEDAKALLRHAMNSIGISAQQFYTAIAVAKSIAALCEDTDLRTSYIAEALHYMMKTSEF